MSSMESVVESVKAIDKGIETMVVTQREFADRLLSLEQKAAASEVPLRHSGTSFGAKVLKEVRANADLLGKTDKLRIEVKAAGDVTGTSSARVVTGGGVGVPEGMALGVQYAFQNRVIGAVSAHEYSRFLAVEGAAGLQATEGAAKAAVRPTFTLVTQPALTIAGYSKISKQALNDSAELQRAIDVTLRRSIGKALDSELNNGSWGALLTLATGFTSATYTSLADAASEGVATMQEAGFNPDTVVLRPADWLATVTAKASGSGEYLSGSYLAPLPEMLRGLKVVLSPTVTAGKVMVADSSQLELLIVEDVAVEIGTDGNDFTNNVRTILGEMRVIPTFRAVGAVRLITPKP